MNRVGSANIAAGVKPWQFSPYRLGDMGLATVWIILAYGSISTTISDVDTESTMATAHHVVSSLILCVCAVLFIARRPALFRSRSWSSILIALVGTWMMPTLILLPLQVTNDALLTFTTFGLVLTHLVVFWSLLTLRRSFSIFPEARALIRTGPYGVVRHPLYAVYMVMYPLFLIPRLSLIAIAVTVIGIGCEVLRAREEERVLRSAFSEYEDYAETTPQFLPRFR